MVYKLLAFVFLPFSIALSQTNKPAPPPQTPRQTILEVITDSSALQRHLPEATKSYWNSHMKSLPAILGEGMSLGMAAGASADNAEGIFVAGPRTSSNYETFSAGPILMKGRDPQSGTVAELRIDSDDFAGDEDTMDLSFHIDAPNGVPVMPVQLPSIRVQMKLEAGTWRFEEVDFTERIELGSPAFVKQIARQSAEMTELWATDAVRTVISAEAEVLKSSGGRQYACSLEKLAPANSTSDAARMLKSEIQFAEEKGYTIQLSECNATGFHVVAASKEQGQPIYCGDQSGTIKRSSTAAKDCFSSGQPVRIEMDSTETATPK